MMESIFDKIIDSKLSTYTLLKFILRSFFGQEMVIDNKFSTIIHLLSIVYVTVITSLFFTLLATIMIGLVYKIVKVCLKKQEENRFDRILASCSINIIYLIIIIMLIIFIIYLSCFIYYYVSYFYIYLIKWPINKLYLFSIDIYNNVILPIWNSLSNFYINYTKDTISVIVNMFRKG